VDNCSTDTTAEAIATIAEKEKSISYFKLSANIGGSGGFHEGIRFADRSGDAWLWLMDDDALPDPSALEELEKELDTPDSIFGSIAVSNIRNDNSLCWPITITRSNGQKQYADSLSSIPSPCSVNSLPFLGFMIHSSLVKKIGLPVKDYFISGDDTEYCFRALHAGAKIHLVRSSIIRHPIPPRRTIAIAGTTITILSSLQPWKRYYDTRNRILIAKKYLGFRLWTETLPGTLLRWIFIVLFEKDKLKQSIAFLSGTIDGLIDRSGIRWTPPSK
jgi:GT2 family glycosyltransferase